MAGVASGRDTYAFQGNLIQNIGAAQARALSSRHQLPPPAPNFTGRDDKLAELLRQLASDGAAGASISGVAAHGMGGVGKTALAVVLAHRLAGEYPAAQLYRDLRGADEQQRTPLKPAEVMRDFILALHPECGQLPEDVDQLGALYRSQLAEAGQVLVLLDNASDAAQVRPLMPPAGCLLLITSRQHFHLPGLIVHDLACLVPERAAELLLRLAPRAKGHAAEAALLCGLLPLALEVFAGAINDKSITPVIKLLAALRTGQEKLPPVDAAFTVSEALLPAETRTAWHLLAIFTASFDLPAAAAVWEMEPDAARSLMQVLVNASLVEFNEASARFRLHDLARQFCAGRLAERAREKALLRHARHYIAVGKESQRLYLQGGEHVVAGLQLFDRERSHLEAAFAWLLPRGDAPAAALLVSLVDAVAFVGALRFHPDKRIAWLEAQRAAARLAGDRAAEGRALGNLGLAYADLGDARKAIEFMEQVLVITRENGDRRGEGSALGNLGNAYAALGDARKAIEFHGQALVVSRKIGDRRGEGQDLGNLGIAHKNLGDARKAIEFHEQALVVSREFGDRRAEGQDLGNLGNAYAALGDARKAIEFHEQRLVIAREIGDRRGEAIACFNLATELWPAGERARALELMEVAWKIFAEIENPNAEHAGEILQEWRGEMGGGGGA